MPLVSEVLNRPPLHGRAPAKEHELRTTCPQKHHRFSLAQAKVDQSNPLETVYRCPKCDSVTVIVSTPGVVTWKGRGRRIKDWMIRNATELLYRPPGAKADVQLPASPRALD